MGKRRRQAPGLTVQEIARPHRCPRCRTRLLAGEVACWKCGRPVAAPAHAEPPPGDTPPERRPRWPERLLGAPPNAARVASTPQAPPRAASLPMARHVVAYLVCSYVALFGGGIAIFMSVPHLKYPLGIIYTPLVGLGCFVALAGVRLFFNRALPARCPVCQGPARLVGSTPLKYRCPACRYVQTTAVRE